MGTKKMICFLIFCLFLSLSCSNQKADLILTNGEIYTMEEDNPWAAAVVLSGINLPGPVL